MPDRLLRDDLLTSDRWLALPRNTHRLAFICLILEADTLGSMEATDGVLWRLWRDPLTLTARASIPEILESLVAVDLIRMYEVEGKRCLHIPRYRQRLRYLNKLSPLSPWTTDEEKQRIAKCSPGDSQAPTGSAHGAHRLEVEVDVDVEEKNTNTADMAPDASASDSARLVNCPTKKLVELYHELLPMNPECVVLNDKRTRTIRARWREWASRGKYSTEAEGLDFWRRFFVHAAASEFLTGRAPPQPGRGPFVANIDFLFGSAHHVDIIESKYHEVPA